MKKILWLLKPGYPKGYVKLLQNFVLRAGFQLSDIEFVELTPGCMQKKNKDTWIAKPERAREFHSKIAKYDTDLIVCNDQASLYYITDKYISLALTRGSVYTYDSCEESHPHHGKPVIVIDDVKKTKTTRYGTWVQLMDCKKIKRWADGKQRIEPAFDYKVTRTLDDFPEFLDWAHSAFMIGVDIETTGSTISSMQYTCMKRDGTMKTFVVPFYAPYKGGPYWDTAEDELYVWAKIKEVHENDAYKTMQNGSYDATYFIKYHLPFNNYIADSLHMWHSLYPEAPKRLDFIASVCLDYVRYWKDEGKEEDVDKKGSRVPKTKEGLENYWLYGALDTHNTILSTKFLSRLVAGIDWARDNYTNEFTLQFGPCLTMAMTGMRRNQAIHSKLLMDLTETHFRNLHELLQMVGDPEFNPNSGPQVKDLVYRILRAKPLPRKGQSSDKTILKLIQQQSPVLEAVLDKLFATKEPANNLSKYGDKIFLGERFMYNLHAATTPTTRLASKQHNFWVGTNAQNLPKAMRAMLEADKDYVLLDIDYAQSDAYFTAFESEDPLFMETMLGDKDTHCVHAEEFFKHEYKEIFEAYKAGDDWVCHPTKGIRNITKRIVYGSNYFMTGYTLLIQMGIKSAVAAAQFLGYEEAVNWSIGQLANFCNSLLEVHYRRYPNIKMNIQREAVKATRRGNLATCCGGYTRLFFGDLVNDDKLQREFAAFFGQGGTAGNINKAINTIFWDDKFKDVQLLVQVHDSLVMQIPKTRLDLIPDIKAAMENDRTIKGRTFVVPVEVEIGIGWGKRLMNWRDGITYEEVVENDKQWKQKFFG